VTSLEMAYQVMSPGPAELWVNPIWEEVKVALVRGFHMIRELWLTTGMLLNARKVAIV